MMILEQNLEGLTVQDALDILINDFDSSKETIAFSNTNRIITLQHLRDEYRNLDGVLAKHINPIIFEGGPGTDINHYTGSLLTLVMDRILTEWWYTDAYQDLVEQEMVM